MILSLATRDSGLVDPVFEVDPGDAPFPTELDGGKFPGAQYTGHDEARYIHVLADIGDRQPLFGDVHFDALHLMTAYAGPGSTASAPDRENIPSLTIPFSY